VAVSGKARLDLRVGSAEDALDRFEAAWNRIAEGRAAPKLDVLSFPDLPTLLKTLTPARWAILEALREKEAGSIYELAKRLGRDYKNVHTDVAALAALGLIAKDESGVGVPWRAIRAEFRLTE
jgi:predicted transcriptional regulator